MTKTLVLGGQTYLVAGGTIKRCVEFDHGEQAWQTVHSAKEWEAVRSVLKDEADEAARLVRITARTFLPEEPGLGDQLARERHDANAPPEARVRSRIGGLAS